MGVVIEKTSFNSTSVNVIELVRTLIHAVQQKVESSLCDELHGRLFVGAKVRLRERYMRRSVVLYAEDCFSISSKHDFEL